MIDAARHEDAVEQERLTLLTNIIGLTRTPMTILSLVWVGLIIAALVTGLPRPLEWLSSAIWGLFILDFLVQWLVAPQKVTYLRQHWVTAIALVLPALALLRVLGAVRVLRVAAESGSFNLLRVLGAINRGMVAAQRVIGHRKLGYIIAITVMLTFAGAGVMYALESPAALRAHGFGPQVHAGAGLHSYGEAVWWTAMVMTTLGSAYWPISLAGRIVCFFLAVYALSIFGYITATVASFFIKGLPSTPGKGSPHSMPTGNTSLEEQIALMNERLAVLMARLDGDSRDPDSLP